MENKNDRQEPVEELETVSLGPKNSGKTIRIESRLKEEQKQELVQCLRAHADMFAWTHENMPGIDSEVACHKLPIKKGARAVRQKRRCFNQERYEAINGKVEKLLKVGQCGVSKKRLMASGGCVWISRTSTRHTRKTVFPYQRLTSL